MKKKTLILSGILVSAFVILGVYLLLITARPNAIEDADFNITFRYGVEGKNELNTFEGTYRKDMVIDPPITVYLSLSKEEKERIYQKMNDTNFFDYPGYFPQRQDRFVTPNGVYRLKVEYDSKIKEVSWDDNSLFEDENIEKGLNEIKGLIIEIIEDKEEYKIIPTPRALYL